MQAIILFASFFILLILAVPIGYSIGIATLIALVFGGDGSIPLLMIAQKAITGCDSFPLMAVPFFMLAGNLMSGGGIAKRILDFFDTFMGFITGGLSMVTTITCMFFAAISGSAMATTSAVGSFMIPAMKEHGYEGLAVTDSCELQNPFAVAAAAFSVEDSPYSYAVIIKLTTMAGPVPAVYLYDTASPKADFVCFLTLGKRVERFLTDSTGLSLIEYWAHRLPQILSASDREVQPL